MTTQGAEQLTTAEDLWRAHAGELLRYATALVGPHDAEDVVSVAFGRVMARIDAVGVVEPRAYLFRAVTNEAHDQRRRRTRQWRRDLMAIPMPVASDDPLVEVRDAVASLSVRQRAVVFLMYWHDMTERDVAGLLDISPGAVRRHIVRAREHLRKVLI